MIGGFTKGGRTFDAVVLGRYDGSRLMYVARTRVGFTPVRRERLMAKLRPLEVPECTFGNLPEARSGPWGEGLTAEKLKECVWVRPELLAEVEFVEWTPDGHLRHARFVGLKDGYLGSIAMDHRALRHHSFTSCSGEEQSAIQQ